MEDYNAKITKINEEFKKVNENKEELEMALEFEEVMQYHSKLISKNPKNHSVKEALGFFFLYSKNLGKYKLNIDKIKYFTKLNNSKYLEEINEMKLFLDVFEKKEMNFGNTESFEKMIKNYGFSVYINTNEEINPDKWNLSIVMEKSEGNALSRGYLDLKKIKIKKCC
jgi:hypothetical protein